MRSFVINEEMGKEGAATLDFTEQIAYNYAENWGGDPLKKRG